MPEPSVHLEGVSYLIGSKVLVTGIDLQAGSGEFIGLIGPNGAGKSTLLSLIGGRLMPSSGEVKLLGASTAGRSPIELAVSRSMLSQPMMGQVPFTVRTVVESGRNPHRRAEGNRAEADEEAVASAMKATHTTGMGGRAYATLSTGEQARVQVARILAHDAPVALLDEPTASLDIANTETILSTLTEGHGARHTTICVLHDLNAASYYADRLILLSDGRIVADGTPEDVLTTDLLSEVYGQPMRVVSHPFRDCPLVLLDG